ncbi:MAG TPA: hypothetical protein PK992_19345, partial [Planctomycetaceae bacterium]|nr:hypothetical protein [Planctomycetaceae bacterium]
KTTVCTRSEIHQNSSFRVAGCSENPKKHARNQDHPTIKPCGLLLVTTSARRNNPNRPPRIVIPGLILPGERKTTITGLSRMSGTKLFDYDVLSRFPVPSLQFKITPQQHLDLQAFGNRVRFVPAAVANPDGKPNAVD